MPERPAPLVLVATPDTGQPFGTHAAVAAEGQRLLAAELSHRLGRLGAAVAPASRSRRAADGAIRLGAVVRGRGATGARAARRVDAIGYAGAGALALLDDAGLDALLSPIPGEVVANNRFSADAFVVAGDLDRALAALEGCESDNARAARAQRRRLGVARPGRRRLGAVRRRHDPRPGAPAAGDPPGRNAAARRLGARLPGDGAAAGRSGAGGAAPGRRSARSSGTGPPSWSSPGACRPTTWQMLETETACRVRALVEERGMRSAPRLGAGAALDPGGADGPLVAGRAGRGAGAAGRRGRARHPGADGRGGGVRGRARPGRRRRSASPRTSATRRGSRRRGCGSWSRRPRAHRSRSCSAGMRWSATGCG